MLLHSFYNNVVTYLIYLHKRHQFFALKTFYGCKNNYLFPNLSECCHVTFTKNLKPLSHKCNINGTVLRMVHNAMDLGVMFHHKMFYIYTQRA